MVKILSEEKKNQELYKLAGLANELLRSPLSSGDPVFILKELNDFTWDDLCSIRDIPKTDIDPLLAIMDFLDIYLIECGDWLKYDHFDKLLNFLQTVEEHELGICSAIEKAEKRVSRYIKVTDENIHKIKNVLN